MQKVDISVSTSALLRNHGDLEPGPREHFKAKAVTEFEYYKYIYSTVEKSEVGKFNYE